MIATKANCSLIQKKDTIVFPPKNTSAYYVFYKFKIAVKCSDGTSIPIFDLDMTYDVKYTEPYIHVLPHDLHEFTVDDWTDYKDLEKLQTGLAKQLIARYNTFSQENYHWIWPVLAISLAVLYCATTAALIYCWCKMFCKVKRTSVRTIEQVVKYVCSKQPWLSP